MLLLCFFFFFVLAVLFSCYTVKRLVELLLNLRVWLQEHDNPGTGHWTRGGEVAYNLKQRKLAATGARLVYPFAGLRLKDVFFFILAGMCWYAVLCFPF